MKSKLAFSLLSYIFIIGLGGSNTYAQSAFNGFYGQISTGYESNQLGSISGTASITPNANSDTFSSWCRTLLAG